MLQLRTVTGLVGMTERERATVSILIDPDLDMITPRWETSDITLIPIALMQVL